MDVPLSKEFHIVWLKGASKYSFAVPSNSIGVEFTPNSINSYQVKLPIPAVIVNE